MSGSRIGNPMKLFLCWWGSLGGPNEVHFFSQSVVCLQSIHRLSVVMNPDWPLLPSMVDNELAVQRENTTQG